MVLSATSDIPAELNYRIAVTPDANSGSGFAEGTVTTTIVGSIMKARNWNDYGVPVNGVTNGAAGKWNQTAATNS